MCVQPTGNPVTMFNPDFMQWSARNYTSHAIFNKVFTKVPLQQRFAISKMPIQNGLPFKKIVVSIYYFPKISKKLSNLFLQKTYNHAKVVNVANMRIEEPTHVNPAEQNWLGENGPVNSVGCRNNHPKPRAMPLEQDLSNLRWENFHTSVERQAHFGHCFSTP